MRTRHTYNNLFAYIAVCLLTVFLASCGGSSGGGSSDSPFVENYIEIESKPGPIVAVRVGEQAVLEDGKSFAASAQALTYDWSFTHIPYGSNAILQGANTASPTFIADVRGVYMVQLIVSAEGVTSKRSVTTVVATVAPERLTGPFNHLGLSSNCVNCHDGINLQVSGNLITPKTPNHVGTSNTCQTCHAPLGFNQIPFVDHQEVFGTCSGCHNGTLAIGKSEFHTPTNAECDDCHNTTSFLDLLPDGSFDHTNITRACAGCHNGTVALGKTPSTVDTPPGTHPDTQADCGFCHTTLSFLNAYPDHTGPLVTGPGITCDSCHVPDGSGPALGHAGIHPAMNVDCDSCHTIATFQMPGGLFNHSKLDAIVQPCETCHADGNLLNAPSKSSAVPAHIATNADCGSCHYTTSFTPAFGVDHTGIINGCSNSCHVADGSGTASGKPLSTPFYEHMPTDPANEDCSHCHTPGTFTTGTYRHAQNDIDFGTTTFASNTCNDCHNDVISIGKLLSHIPTQPDTQACDACHVSTTDFKAVVYSHPSITSDCVSCHDGFITTGQPNTHVPTTQSCDNCHDISPTPFKPAVNFAHSGINSNCESCHDGNLNYVAAGALGKPANHIPALNVCRDCHAGTNTGDFASPATFLLTQHSGYTTGCEGCHTTPYITNPAALKASTHLPTNQDCDVCHANSTSPTFAPPTIFSHDGISGNCQSCHDGSADNVAAGALGKAQSTNPHPSTTSDCNACHAIGNNFTDGTFDHTGIVNNCSSCHGDNPTNTPVGPKKNAGHVPTNEDCSLCHVTGTFLNAVFNHTGIVDNCASCHDGAGAVGTVKPTDTLHNNITEDCSVCHNTTAFAGARFDHLNIVDNCSACHDGTTARGKTPPPNHVPTNEDCAICHQTTGFVPGTFSHVGIVDNCASCHDGSFAIGKSSAHVPTNQDCSVCHTTTTFIGAVFDHTGIVDNCASCHDGVTAKGKDAKTNPPHIDTALDCSSCHTTATFVGGTWTHDSTSTGNCDQCHSPNGGATFKPQNHLATTVQCDVCHVTTGWAPTSFSHSPQGNYPGDHRRDPGCSGCHGNSIDLPFNYPSSRYAPFCAACHERDFKRKGDHIGGENGTVEQNKDCSGGGRGCHKVSDKEF